MLENQADHASFATPDLLWDVIEEHFDEATYGAAQLVRVLLSPLRNLADLARYPEQRLLAHIDALLVAGDAARARLLVPALEEADPGDPARTSVAAWAVMEAGAFEALAPALSHADGAVRAAVGDAARWTSHPNFDGWLSTALKHDDPALRLGLLELAIARQYAPERLLEWLQADDPALIEVAARAALFAPGATYLSVMRYLLEQGPPSTRDPALLACASWEPRIALHASERWALDAAQPSAVATQLYALLGGHAEHQRLTALLQTRTALHSVLAALALSGNVTITDAVLPSLHGKDERAAKLAAQTLALLYGLDLNDAQFDATPPRQPSESTDELPAAEADAEAAASLPPLEEDDLDADLTPAPVDELPPPNAEAIERFCSARAAGLKGGKRVLCGAPLGAPNLALVFAQGPLGWRHMLAVSLGVLTRGHFWLDTRGLSHKQRSRQASVSGLSFLVPEL